MAHPKLGALFGNCGALNLWPKISGAQPLEAGRFKKRFKIFNFTRKIKNLTLPHRRRNIGALTVNFNLPKRRKREETIAILPCGSGRSRNCRS